MLLAGANTWEKIEKNSPWVPPGSMLPPSPSILFSSSVLCPAKAFMLLKMKLEPKGKGEAAVAKDDTEKGSSWWQHQFSPTRVRILPRNKQKVVNISGACRSVGVKWSRRATLCP